MAEVADGDREDYSSASSAEEDGIEDVDPDEEVLELEYDITSYRADLQVDGLVTRLVNGDIVIPTFDPDVSKEAQMEGFQRQFVWTKPQCDRFVESLLLGFPVPGVFLVRQPGDFHLVLDGHQRLRTLQCFYKGVLRDRTFQLTYVQPQLVGLTYADLDDSQRRRLDNSLIHATILRQDKPDEHQQAVFLIFERINSGGTPLRPHEIRIALYSGPFVQLIRELNRLDSWRKLVGPVSPRFKDHELILRFFALYHGLADYHRPMKGFLNQYIEMNRNLQRESEEDLVRLFNKTCTAVLAGIGTKAFRPVAAVNAAVLDSIMYGVGKRLSEGPITEPRELGAQYEALMRNQEYRFATERATADDESVRVRLRAALEAFSQTSR
jgi:hypothetical protein